jgi:hypothetical protein
VTKPDAHHPTSEELFAYRDGELPNERRTHVEAHVIVCAHCKDRIDEMSALESDLRMRPDDVGDEYYERMTESVLGRARQPVPADEVEEAVVAPAAAPRSRRGARRESEPPPFDRRRPDVVSDEIDSRRRFRLPWIGIAGSGAAAAAVLIVAVMLFQRQQAWLQSPRPAAVGERDAAVREAGGASKAKRKTAAPGVAADGKAVGNKKQATGSAMSGKLGATASETAPAPSVAKTRSNEGESGSASPAAGTATTSELKLQTDTQPSEERTRDEVAPPTDQVDKDAQAAGELKKESLQSGGGNDSAIASGVRQQTAPMASLNENQLKNNQPVRSTALAPPPGAPGEPYAQVLREHSLPAVWNSSVSREALLKAEPDLKRVYQTHKAGADSARIRLYLAEAERAKIGNPPDATHMDAAVNHYRRTIALALAHGDTALADVARRRLAQLFGVTQPSNPAPSSR